MIELRAFEHPKHRLASFRDQPVKIMLTEPEPRVNAIISVNIGFLQMQVVIDEPMEADCNYDKLANATRLITSKLEEAFKPFLK